LILAPGAGVVVALPDEARTLTRARLQPGAIVPVGDSLLLALCGVGPERAARAAQELLDCGVRALASWGTAGALDPKLGRAALVLPKRVIDDAGNSYPVDSRWRWRLEQALSASVPVVGGPLLSSARPLTTAKAKAEAFIETGAIAVDMESAAVAGRAEAAGRPFVALRSITDTAAEALPRAALEAVDADGRLQPLRLLRAVLTRPSDILALMALGRHFAQARRALDTAAAHAPGLLAMGEPES